MKIALTKLSTKDLATLAQRIISNIQSGKYPVITNHPLTATLQSSYTEYDKYMRNRSTVEKERTLLRQIMKEMLPTPI
jgi:hypothetical protein